MRVFKAEDWRTMRRKLMREVNCLRQTKPEMGIGRWISLQKEVRRFTRRDWLAGRIR